jgi:hypothetical protein
MTDLSTHTKIFLSAPDAMTLDYQMCDAAKPARKLPRWVLVVLILAALSPVLWFGLYAGIYWYVDHTYFNSWSVGDTRKQVERKLFLFSARTNPRTDNLLWDPPLIQTDLSVDYHFLGTDWSFSIAYDASGKAIRGFPTFE